jgi:hypothetical protein
MYESCMAREVVPIPVPGVLRLGYQNDQSKYATTTTRRASHTREMRNSQISRLTIPE